MSKPMMLPPKMCAQYAERARNGDYQFRLGSDIYIWLDGNQKVVVIGTKPGANGHVVQLTSDQALQEKKSLGKAMQRQEERRR